MSDTHASDPPMPTKLKHCQLFRVPMTRFCSCADQKFYTKDGLMWEKYMACARDIRRDFNNIWDRRVLACSSWHYM